jgi:hypothetical protein
VLAQTIVLIAAIAILALSAIAGIAGNARAQAANAAKALVAPAVESAVAQYQHVVAATIAAQAGTVTQPALVNPSTVAALNGQTVWPEQSPQPYRPDPASPLAVAVDIRPTAVTLPACAAAGSGPDIERNGQCSPFVQESRLSLQITTDVGPLGAAGGVVALAHSRVTVTLRLSAQAPYAMIAGIKDAADPSGFHEGDSGGYGNALGTFAPSPAPDDTTIHVLWACVPAAGSCAASAPPPADQPASRPWTNGNGQP